MSDAVPQVTVTALSEMRRDGQAHAVLDVREDWERQVCRIDGSLDCPLATVPENLEILPRDKPLVVLCHHGMRSLQATLWLRAQGFENAVNLAGGIDAWRREIDPTMEAY